MAVANPCGLSVERVVNIIKNNVVSAKYNGRNAMMQGLMSDPTLNLSYSEARQVSDYYYSVYKKIALQNKSTALPIIHHLNATQKTQRQVDNLALDYLSGRTGGFPMSDADIEHLEAVYKKSDLAATPSLKAKFDEEANVFIQKLLPTYANELFRSSVYARPLLSTVFFIKSLTSNLHAQIERSISNSIWDGRKADFTSLFKFDGLANASFVDVMKGGIPATTIAHNEHFDFSKGRLEEFDMKGTPIEKSNLFKRGYYGLMKFYTKYSNRFNAAPDSRGIYSNAERHMYQLLKEKHRDMGVPDDRATQLALQEMELDDKATSIRMAEAKFNELGLPITNKKGKYTSEFNVAVKEYRRLKRDNVIWARALELSKNDFWKRNMTVASDLGFGDYGLFGLKAQFFQAVKSKFESKTKSKLNSAFNLYAFGFLNGASNFAEDAIERFPLYGAVKLAFLQARKGNVTDQDLYHDIARRQKDIIVKNITTAGFFLAARMLERLICGDKQDKVSTADLSADRTQIGVCGIPVVVPPQMMAMFKVYSLISQASNNDEEFFDTALNILPILVQSNNLGLGGSIDKMATDGTDYVAALRSGNEIRVTEAKAKLAKDMIRSAADVANTYIPLPSRALNEAGTVVQRISGKTARQQALNIAIDDQGKPLSWIHTLGKISVANLANVTGVNEIIVAALGSKKPEAMDWQGRSVVQLRGSDITGNGIQYNDKDELLIDAGIQPPYVARVEKITVKTNTQKEVGFLPNDVLLKTKDVRYMTDDEFYNLSKALSEFNNKYLDNNLSRIRKVLDKNKPLAKKQLETVFNRTKTVGLRAIEKGITSPEKILRYVENNWLTERDQTITQTIY